MIKLLKKLNRFLDKQEEKSDDYIVAIKKDVLGTPKVPKNLTIICRFDDNEELLSLAVWSERLTRRQAKEVHQSYNQKKE